MAPDPGLFKTTLVSPKLTLVVEVSPQHAGCVLHLAEGIPLDVEGIFLHVGGVHSANGGVHSVDGGVQSAGMLLVCWVQLLVLLGLTAGTARSDCWYCWE